MLASRTVAYLNVDVAVAGARFEASATPQLIQLDQLIVQAAKQGMDFTIDKLRSLVKKQQSLIEAHVNVKTSDSYTFKDWCHSSILL
ncbi:hypothetical protein ACS0TY_034367 [Phlomoides rotata]